MALSSTEVGIVEKVEQAAEQNYSSDSASRSWPCRSMCFMGWCAGADLRKAGALSIADKNLHLLKLNRDWNSANINITRLLYEAAVVET